MKSVAKNIRISPKKANLIAKMIRGKEVPEAKNILTILPKKGAKVLNKVLKSAVANAKTNFKQEEENLVVKEVVITKAPTFKRWVPASRGRVHPVRKRNSHISLQVTAKEVEQKPAKTAESKKTEEKAEAKPEVKAEKTAKKTTKTATKKTDNA
ncbi:50S ribosomal protein L22 [Candidatus Peregrinibacteria bacterium]|nr:50S ribosomal protein L22 [Candidatus Peregrinibacteria bacterium]